MRWPAKVQNSWDWQRRFAWYPIRVDYEDGASEWIWLESVETRLIVREGGAWTLLGHDDPATSR